MLIKKVKCVLTFFLLSCAFLCPNVWALTSLTIKNTTVDELNKIYQKYGYQHYLYVKHGEIPPIFLEHLPSDYKNLKESNMRNQLFLRIVIPLALKLKEEILLERHEMISVRKNFVLKGELSQEEWKKLENWAKKYDVFTYLKGKVRAEYMFDKLMSKINWVYPSILVAVAAVQTDWGSSRIVAEGNSLYKELVWHTNEGLEPQGETQDHTYRIRVFPNLYESMKAFALKYNSSVSFEHARYLRQIREKTGITPAGRDVVHSMLFQTPLENYIGILNYVITFYELNWLERLKLAAKLEDVKSVDVKKAQ